MERCDREMKGDGKAPNQSNKRLHPHKKAISTEADAVIQSEMTNAMEKRSLRGTEGKRRWKG